MQEQGEGCILGMIRDGLCVNDLLIDEGSQHAIHEHVRMICLSGSGNGKARRTGGVLDRTRVAAAM